MSSSGVKDTAQVANSCKKLYEPLPASISIPDQETSSVGKVQTLPEFLSNNLPQSERSEIAQEAKKTLSFKKGQKVTKKNAAGNRRQVAVKKGKYLTSRERRVLGLQHLTNYGFKFDDFLSMHHLWLDYMRKVIGCPEQHSPAQQQQQQQPSLCSDSLLTIGDEQLQMRISRADFHGALVKIIKASSSERVGTEGYVVMETRNTLKILTKKSKVTTVPKKGSAFSFCVDDYLFSVEASNMCIKPSERAIKKWKTKPPLNM